MEPFEVIRNRHIADEFENDVSCDLCKQLGTVVILFKRRVCKTCLQRADVAIGRAILDSCNLGGPYYVPHDA